MPVDAVSIMTGTSSHARPPWKSYRCLVITSAVPAAASGSFDTSTPPIGVATRPPVLFQVAPKVAALKSSESTPMSPHFVVPVPPLPASAPVPLVTSPPAPPPPGPPVDVDVAELAAGVPSPGSYAVQSWLHETSSRQLASTCANGLRAVESRENGTRDPVYQPD